MKTEANRIQTTSTPPKGKTRGYNDIVEYLSSRHQDLPKETHAACVKALDKELGHPSKLFNTIFITGANGKSITAHFTTQLLHEEGLTVGTLQTPHLLSYNERILVGNDAISTKTFSDHANTVIDAAQRLKVEPHALDVLFFTALLYFKTSKVDAVTLEIDTDVAWHPAYICSPKIFAVTRLTNAQTQQASKIDTKILEQQLEPIGKDAYVVSADQGKANLQHMQAYVEKRGANWMMPIRKLAPLPYPFEQLHGRCAALAERIARTYVNDIAADNATVVSSSLLTQKKGHRGRPTLKAKRQSELNPKRTIEQFWRETISTLPGRFQLLEREKPTILLDNASNIDAFENLLLGVRLLHYQRPLKGLALIIGTNNSALASPDFFKLVRYFFKKTSGHLFICPVKDKQKAHAQAGWNVEKVANEMRNMKIKAKACASFQEAFESCKQHVDERHGLVVIAGSTEVIAQYWDHKGIKRI